MVSEEDQKTARGTVVPTNALALMVQTELKLDPHSGITVIRRALRASGRAEPRRPTAWFPPARPYGAQGSHSLDRRGMTLKRQEAGRHLQRNHDQFRGIDIDGASTRRAVGLGNWRARLT